jgi:hypothetical protein
VIITMSMCWMAVMLVGAHQGRAALHHDHGPLDFSVDLRSGRSSSRNGRSGGMEMWILSSDK